MATPIAIAIAKEDLEDLTILLASLHDQGQTYTYIALYLTNTLTQSLGYSQADTAAIIHALEDNYTQSILNKRYNITGLANDPSYKPLVWPNRYTLVTY